MATACSKSATPGSLQDPLAVTPISGLGALFGAAVLEPLEAVLSDSVCSRSGTLEVCMQAGCDQGERGLHYKGSMYTGHTREAGRGRRATARAASAV